ncbi:hypothetical protein HMPREF1978_00795 [Actinomyces graevenitzii F0530]|uniref:Uncharacterized protein n=1 Tax=Actinomyces graevenitzii F0530 TaxID=1321817 RepID=U1Q4B5_9ACTO|nr:hypothetical protein HMPREF1978_00795 [Actinomyces graevenitzii F0530]
MEPSQDFLAKQSQKVMTRFGLEPIGSSPNPHHTLCALKG